MVWKGRASAACCLFAIDQPIVRGKVHGLSAIEAQIETAVVGPSVQHDELSCLLLSLCSQWKTMSVPKIRWQGQSNI